MCAYVVSGQSESKIEVKKSIFIATVREVHTEEEALSFLEEMRKTYWDAKHNCYAYIIGANMGIMRYSDDGEPGGTAGLPMMEVVKARQVTNCIVVVTRYFGGVLLGAGGLVRAYSQGAALAIDACGVGTVFPTARLGIQISYSLLGKAEYALKSLPVIVEDKDFAADVTITLAVRTKDEADTIKALAAALDGRLEAVRLEEYYRAWEE